MAFRDRQIQCGLTWVDSRVTPSALCICVSLSAWLLFNHFPSSPAIYKQGRRGGMDCVRVGTETASGSYTAAVKLTRTTQSSVPLLRSSSTAATHSMNKLEPPRSSSWSFSRMGRSFPAFSPQLSRGKKHPSPIPVQWANSKTRKPLQFLFLPSLSKKISDTHLLSTDHCFLLSYQRWAGKPTPRSCLNTSANINPSLPSGWNFPAAHPVSMMAQWFI